MDDARTQGKKKSFHPGSRISGRSRWFICAGIMVLVVTAFSVMSAWVTLADDQPIPSMTIGYQNGMITAIHEKTLDIDGRTYGLIQEVVILNQTGGVMEPRDLVVTAEVKFHVTKEDNNKIDKLIVTLPR